MSNSFYGLGISGTSSFFDSFFGSSTSNSSSVNTGSSMLSDLTMIKNGSYKKMMRAYYEKQSAEDETETIKGSGTVDTNVQLSNTKTTSKNLNEAAKKLQNMNYDSATRNSIMDAAKDFVSDYNSSLTAAKKLNSYSILQTAVWMTDQTSASEKVLNDVGITINGDNTLSLDESKFKEANLSAVKSVFSGTGSYASQISQKASSMYNQSVNQLALNSGKYLYSMSGLLG